jgi:hypothetical protein
VTLGSHQTTVGKSQVHITPKWIIDALGPFDLDPCAAAVRPWDCTRHNCIEMHDGLGIDWFGFVWLNPPFERYGVGRWIEKLAVHGSGIALLHARTETAWFKPCWEHASALLFLSHRLIFHKPDGSPQTIANPESKHFGKPANSGAPVVLVGFGPTAKHRLEHFGPEGVFVTQWRMQDRKVRAAP